MVQYLRRIREAIVGHSGSRLTPVDIENVVGGTEKKMRSVDPDTGTRWRSLRLAIEPSPYLTALPQVAARQWRIRLAISFGIVTVALIGAGIVWLRQPNLSTYATSKGQHSTITLADSSEVTLNYTSSLTVTRFPFDRARHVSLNGEAFFRVRNNGTPFIVSTDAGTISVLGTEFNVRLRSGRLEVAVVRGKVLLEARREGKDSSVILTTGQISSCTAGEFPASPGALEFREYPGWLHGKIVFSRTRISAVCDEIESQFDVAVKILNPQLRDEFITGAIEAHSAESAMSTLARLTGTAYRYENGGYTLY
jgi:ferric-dicitrate binding protein FerR (iron transport regulator)